MYRINQEQLFVWGLDRKKSTDQQEKLGLPLFDSIKHQIWASRVYMHKVGCIFQHNNQTDWPTSM